MKVTYRELGSRRELIDAAKQIFTNTGFIELGKEPEDIITADSGLYFSYTFLLDLLLIDRYLHVGRNL